MGWAGAGFFASGFVLRGAKIDGFGRFGRKGPGGFGFGAPFGLPPGGGGGALILLMRQL